MLEVPEKKLYLWHQLLLVMQECIGGLECRTRNEMHESFAIKSVKNSAGISENRVTHIYQSPHKILPADIEMPSSDR